MRSNCIHYLDQFRLLTNLNYNSDCGKFTTTDVVHCSFSEIIAKATLIDDSWTLTFKLKISIELCVIYTLWTVVFFNYWHSFTQCVSIATHIQFIEYSLLSCYASNMLICFYMLFKIVWSSHNSSSSILNRNTHKATVKCNQEGQIFSLRFAYLHNPEISMEQQIFPRSTACSSGIRLDCSWNFAV